MAKEVVNISVADDYIDRFSEVVKACKKTGLKVEQQMEQIGVVSGAIDSAKVAALSKVKGVAHVERPRQIQLPPPESDVQ
jgi:hypothetical protein